MAQIVLIDTGTERKDLAYSGDIVAIHEDDVRLDGIGYKDFKIIKVDIDIKALDKIIYDSTPEVRHYSKSRKIEVETSAGNFEEVEKEAKYSATLKDLSSTEILAVESKETSAAVTEATLKNKIKSCTLDQFDTLKVVSIETKS